MSKKKWLITAAAVICITAAAVFVYRYLNRYDASDYVRAVLDVSYKNETELYTEITGVSEEEAEKIFLANLDRTMEDFESSEMPEELVPEYRQLFSELAGHVNYTTGEPLKEDDGIYVVPVNIKPVTLFTDTYGTFQKKAAEYADQITERVMQGEDMPSEEEMQAEIYRIYYEVLRERMDSGMLYGGVRNVELHVRKDGAREFEIRQEDMDRLDEILIESADDPDESSE